MPDPKVEHTIKAEAADTKHGMTLGELAAFVDEARSQKISDGTVVKTTLTWRSSIKKLEISG
jgi:uncharacterized protein YbbC (DUF1343 family)